jgi:hypothetical protein
MSKLFTIAYICYGGVTIDAEDEDDALRKFEKPEVRRQAYNELSYNPLDITDIIEEE